MSTFYVNQVYDLFATYDGSPVIWVDCSEVEDTFFVDTTDALSNPSVEDLLPSGLALWPRGAAWGTPDNAAPSTETVIAGLTRATLAPFAELYRRLWQITAESRASTIVDSLPDWETDYGLPEPCITDEQTVAARMRHLRAKVASTGTISPEDFVRLAAFLGFVIALEEPDAFLAGESDCGSYFEVSDVALEQQWVVHILDAPVTQFEAGIGEAGITRLLDFSAEALECSFDRVSPAWTYPIYSFAGWPLPFAIDVGDGFALGTEDGHYIVAPALADA